MSTHSEQVESIGAYALGALPELEAHAFERHLMACEECQEELRRLNQAVEALPRSVTPHEPPASLKASLMEVVNAEAAPAQVRRRPLLRLPQLRPALAWAAAACVLAAGAGYGVSEVMRDGTRTIQAQVDRTRLPDGMARLVVAEDAADGSVLRVYGFPEPAGNRIYQVWVERRGEVEPVSIFDVDASGDGAAAVPESLEDVSAVMVTREPRGGSRQPTEAPVLRVDV